MSASNVSPDCALLRKLPLEIRFMIYGGLLVRPSQGSSGKRPAFTLMVVTNNDRGYEAILQESRSSRSSRLYPQILCACKQIYEEAIPMLYEQNEFLVINSTSTSNTDLRKLPSNLSRLVRNVHLTTEPSSFLPPLSTLLSRFPHLQTVRVRSYWPKTYYTPRTGVSSEDPDKMSQNNLDGILDLSRYSRIKHLSCTFVLPQVIPGTDASEINDQLQTALNDWFPYATETAKFTANDLENSSVSIAPPSFRFHRKWMRQIREAFGRCGVLVGIPIAWRFETVVVNGQRPLPGLEMTVNKVQNRIPCEVISVVWKDQETKILWQNLEDAEDEQLEETSMAQGSVGMIDSRGASDPEEEQDSGEEQDSEEEQVFEQEEHDRDWEHDSEQEHDSVAEDDD
ncbi:hypothetical protein BT63DRAFT_415423 [Microthyrium microscopicum]|uniref:DUF7730 domain-containing protein n=1 Tax=Microthyrium microscopicum TaxID=703497 RepID=A0A6A6U8F8_9PEZI|nr:hypothetical protein BT63DRAFT_415423 [Microthyrium microscopicum]